MKFLHEGRQQRKNELAYSECINRLTDVIRDPKIVGNLAINGYVGGVACQRTLEQQRVLTGTLDRVDDLGEFDDRQPGEMGRDERYFIGREFARLFSGNLDCASCPYTNVHSSDEVVEAFANQLQVKMNQQLTNPSQDTS